jgi:hypothetical protein
LMKTVHQYAEKRLSKFVCFLSVDFQIEKILFFKLLEEQGISTLAKNWSNFKLLCPTYPIDANQEKKYSKCRFNDKYRKNTYRQISRRIDGHTSQRQ